MLPSSESTAFGTAPEGSADPPLFFRLQKNDKEDRNSIYYYFDKSVQTRKDAECLVCENVSLSWVDVAQREFGDRSRFLCHR